MERPVENIHVVVLKNFLHENNVSLKGLTHASQGATRRKVSSLFAYV